MDIAPLSDLFTQRLPVPLSLLLFSKVLRTILLDHILIQMHPRVGFMWKNLAPPDMGISQIPHGALARITDLSITTCTTHLTRVKKHLLAHLLSVWTAELSRWKFIWLQLDFQLGLM